MKDQKPQSKKAFKSNQGKPFGTKPRSTLQTITDATAGERTLFNGGSPIVFNAVRNTIQRNFLTEGVWDMISYGPDVHDPADLQENEFAINEPDAGQIDQILNANRAAAIANYDLNLAELNALYPPGDAENARRRYDLAVGHRNKLEEIDRSRSTLTRNHLDSHKNWIVEREKFDKRRRECMKVFMRTFGAITLSSVKHFLDQTQFRRAWFEICEANITASHGQNNTTILLNELRNTKFNAAITSFISLEQDQNLLWEQLVRHGEPAPTDESKLYHIIEALKNSPGKEFAEEINHINLMNLDYLHARQLLLRKAGTIASTTTLDRLHQGRSNAAQSSLDVHANATSKKVRKCDHCGKTSHNKGQCWLLKTCDKCGQTGHVPRFCKNDVPSPSERKTEDLSASSVGNRFASKNVSNSNTNKNSVYCNILTLSGYGSEPPLSMQSDHNNTNNSSDYNISQCLADIHLDSNDYITSYYITSVLANSIASYQLNLSDTDPPPVRILIDSGANTHMLPRNMITRGYKSSSGIVRQGDSTSSLSIVGVGDTNLHFIYDVLCVPDLRIGLLSVSRFELMGLITQFNERRGVVYSRNGDVYISSTMSSDGLYIVDSIYIAYLLGHTTVPAILATGGASGMAIGDEQSRGTPEHLHAVTKQVVSNVVAIPRTPISSTTTSDGDLCAISNLVVSQSSDCCNPANSVETHYNLRVDESSTMKDESSSVNMNNNIYATTTNHVISSNKMSTGMGLNPLEILHRQWGHIGPDAIKRALREGLVSGCKYSYNGIKDLDMRVCMDCLKGRMRARSEAPTTDHQWGPLEKIAIDYKGDFARKAVGGFKGFMLLVDYATNYVYADLVKSKAEHTRVLKDFKLRFHTAHGKKWKVLQSDSESIFKSRRVEQWLRKEEICLQLSTPYQHWQNGQVEVYVGIVMDKTRTIMSAYNVPIKYWGYAVQYACHVMNMLPNSNTGISAYQSLSGCVPNVSNLVPFYAPGVFHTTKDERKSNPWAPKALPCRMLGYAEHYLNAYSILNVTTGRIIIRENCVFNISVSADDVDDINVDRTDERNDIDEYDIMLDESGSDVSDNASDNSNSSANNESEYPDAPDTDINDIAMLPEADEDDMYWHEYANDTSYSVYDHWYSDSLHNVSNIPPLPENPKSVDDALAGPHKELWERAIEKELNQFQLRHTFGDADQVGYGMKTKLILYYKYDAEYNLVCKARLVLCGYSQRKNIDYFETYSPTTTIPIVFLLLCIAGNTKCHVGSFDVSAAYLEGKSDVDMYAWLPPEIDNDRIKRRIRIIGNWYGSKQAGKIWNDLFNSIVISMGFEQCFCMPCLYRYVDNNTNDYMFLTEHVDDGMALTNNVSLLHDFLSALLNRVQKAVMYDTVQLYLGMDIMRSMDLSVFTISQTRYIINKCNECTRAYTTPMSTTTNLRLCEHNPDNTSLLPDTGMLRYLADRTRPDILAALGEVSSGGEREPSDEHVDAVNRIKCYLSTTKEVTMQLGGSDPLELFGYCDAAYITTGNCKSRLGSCLFINRDSGAFSSVSRNDTTVSHSSTEAEIKAIDMIAKEIVYYRMILAFLGFEQLQPTKVYVDNKSAMDICKTIKLNHRVRHVNVKVHYIRELINQRVIELIFIPTEFNVADVLTKALIRVLHDRHSSILIYGHNCVAEAIYEQFKTYEYYANKIEYDNNTNEVIR